MNNENYNDYEQSVLQDRVYLDKGSIPIVQPNQRFINHSHLSAVAPDFIPQLVLPNLETVWQANLEQKYPVENIDGPQWLQLIDRSGKTIIWKGKEIPPLSFSDHIHIAIQTLKELQFLFENYGLVLTDRNPMNIQLLAVDGPGHISFGGTQWKVYQVDFHHVYDAITDKGDLEDNLNLLQRKGHLSEKDYQDSLRTKEILSRSIMKILETVNNLQGEQYFATTISPATESEIRQFYQDWNRNGQSKENQKQFIDIQCALEYLDRLSK